MSAVDWEALRAHAAAARAHAYAPYSRFQVGAALLTESGEIFAGANVENASYGLCLCAERSAVAAAIVTGVRAFEALAIVAPGPRPVTPCGMCRQVLAEFGPSFPIHCYTPEGARLETSVEALLPHAFDKATLDGAESE